MNTAIVLAGGLGTRLASVSNGTPKVLMPINGKPFIEYVFDNLIAAGISRAVVTASYKWELLHSTYGDKYKTLELLWSIEFEPLGTGGAIKQAFDLHNVHEAVVVNADTIFKVDLAEIVQFHRAKMSQITIAMRHVDDVNRYGEVTVGVDGMLTAFNEKSRSGPGLINGGVYVIDSSFWKGHSFDVVFSFERDCLQQLVGKDRLFGIVQDGYFIDIGIPEDLERAQNELKTLHNS
jgi:D-glycero-alpha-D-manno-heptose 1-phosphate guanylyltransferase